MKKFVIGIIVGAVGLIWLGIAIWSVEDEGASVLLVPGLVFAVGLVSAVVGYNDVKSQRGR
jgi:hypothetical protein